MLPLYIVIGFVVVGAALLMYFYFFSRTVKLTVLTTGQIVRTEEREKRNANERWEETLLVCRFQVRGETREAELIVPGRQAARYPQGREVPVRYNPEDPSMARLAV